LDSRDREISRLGNLYMGGETQNKENLAFVSNQNAQTIKKLE